jgi:hypothetical protein
MRSFMGSGVHHRIMARLPEWCDEAALGHRVQDANQPPSWTQAHQRLQQGDRRSRVNHPSDAQRWFEISRAADQARGGVQVVGGGLTCFIAA